jgi:hypothetical protein
MAKPKPFDLISFVLLISMAGLVAQLSITNSDLRQRLEQRSIECPAVQVTCVCPEYDEGWEEAQVAEGCDPDMTELPIDDLRLICDDLDDYGYIPGC